MRFIARRATDTLTDVEDARVARRCALAEEEKCRRAHHCARMADYFVQRKSLRLAMEFLLVFATSQASTEACKSACVHRQTFPTENPHRNAPPVPPALPENFDLNTSVRGRAGTSSSFRRRRALHSFSATMGFTLYVRKKFPPARRAATATNHSRRTHDAPSPPAEPRKSDAARRKCGRRAPPAAFFKKM